MNTYYSCRIFKYVQDRYLKICSQSRMMSSLNVVVRALVRNANIMQIFSRFQQVDTKHWGLSKSVISFLRCNPELLLRLDRVRHKGLFSADYQPRIIEVFYDDICWIKSVGGQITYSKLPIDQSMPTSIEVRFDDEIAMFSINLETVVDRTANLAPLLELIGNNISIDIPHD